MSHFGRHLFDSSYNPLGHSSKQTFPYSFFEPQEERHS